MSGITRRDFAAAAAAAALVGLDPRNASAGAPFSVHYTRASPSDALTRFITPGLDGFPAEKEAAEIEGRLRRIFAGSEDLPPALRDWAKRREAIRWARFHVLPESRVRFEIAIAGPNGLEHHTGLWALPDFTPVSEDSIARPRSLVSGRHGLFARRRRIISAATPPRQPLVALAPRFRGRYRRRRQSGNRRSRYR